MDSVGNYSAAGYLASRFSSELHHGTWVVGAHQAEFLDITLSSLLTMKDSQNAKCNCSLCFSKCGDIVSVGEISGRVGETPGGMLMMVSRRCLMLGTTQSAGGAYTNAARCSLDAVWHLRIRQLSRNNMFAVVRDHLTCAVLACKPYPCAIHAW
jgi:hypothetical protein